jgi:hypothetical protein
MRRMFRATLIVSTGSAAVMATMLACLWWVARDFGPSDNSALHGAAFIALAAVQAPLLAACIFPLSARLTQRTFQTKFAPFLVWSFGMLAAVSLLFAAAVSWLLGVNELSYTTAEVVALFFLLALAVSVPLVMPWSYVWHKLAREA